MPARHFDVVVAGLGAMGSATAAHLAMRGRRVLGLDLWAPGHRFGSSHGDSRIIREMYFEHPMYVPLLQRAHDLWRDLEKRTGTSVMHIIGGLMIGPEDGALVSGCLRSAREHGLEHEIFDADETARRYPAFGLRDGDVALLDPRAGYLDPEAANGAHMKLAELGRAELRFNDGLESWAPDGDGVRVKTTKGESISADKLVLSTGARTNRYLNGLKLPLEVERQVVFWLQPDASDSRYDESKFPIWAHEYIPGEICYGFPRLQRGVKASVMHAGETVDDADAVNRAVADDEVDPLRKALAGVLPELSRAAIVESDTCLFTNTPDHNFIIDFHPAHPQVLISSACSGHGYKFASVVGEIQADLVAEGRAEFDLTPFSLGRAGIGSQVYLRE